MSTTNKFSSITLMVLLLFSTQACTDIFLAGLPSMAVDFKTTIGVTNLIISVYNYSMAFFVLFLGVVSDLFGRKRTVVICLILHILASLFIALTSLISIVVFMRIIQGLGSAAISIVLRLLIKDTMDKKEQIHVTGLLVMGLVLSPILAPVVGAWLIHYFNWRACFWAITLFEAPLLVWFLLIIQETNYEQKEHRKSFSVKNHFINYYLILKDPYFLSIALIVGATFAAFYSFISISSYLYINEYNVKSTDYSYIFITIAVFYLLGNRIMSGLNKKGVKPKDIIKYGTVVACLGTTLILAEWFLHNKYVILFFITLGVCLIRFSTALINPPAQIIATNYFQQKGSYALGLLTSIQYIFAAAGTVFVSSLPFYPRSNFIISSILFTALSYLGYRLYSANNKLID